MKHHSFRMALAITSLTAAALAPVASAELLAGVSDNGLLVSFPSNDPMAVVKVKIKGLQKKDKILGLDVRPLSGQIYALGSTSRLYVIDLVIGAATEVGKIGDPWPLTSLTVLGQLAE